MTNRERRYAVACKAKYANGDLYFLATSLHRSRLSAIAEFVWNWQRGLVGVDVFKSPVDAEGQHKSAERQKAWKIARRTEGARTVEVFIQWEDPS